MISDRLAVLVVLATVVLVSLWLEDRFPSLRSLGAALMAILFGMALSNSGVLTGSSLLYDFLQDTGVSLGIVLILSSIDLRTIVSAGPSMLAAFGLGAAGTAAGALVSALLLAPAIGDETWKLSGQFTGTYVGGGMNFAALGQALGTTSDLFTAAMAADVILTAVWMAICLLVPVVMGHGIAAAAEESSGGGDEPETLERQLYTSVQAIPLGNAAALVVVALGAVWLSGVLGRAMPVLPEVLWLTTLSLVMGQVRWVKRLAGGAMIGNYLVLLFLASNGAQSVVANIVRVGPSVFYFACLTVAIHGVVIFGAGRLLRLDFGTLAIASQANVGGAASAMAMASARGYLDRLLPGVAVGLLGYALGNYLGFAVATLARSFI